MRIPPNYEEMIRDIARTAGKHGFYFEGDTLIDNPPKMPKDGHKFIVRVELSRYGDFSEDAPVPI